jgi:hypothetical protein
MQLRSEQVRSVEVDDHSQRVRVAEETEAGIVGEFSFEFELGPKCLIDLSATRFGRAHHSPKSSCDRRVAFLHESQSYRGRDTDAVIRSSWRVCDGRSPRPSYVLRSTCETLRASVVVRARPCVRATLRGTTKSLALRGRAHYEVAPLRGRSHALRGRSHALRGRSRYEVARTTRSQLAARSSPYFEAHACVRVYAYAL